MCQMPEAPSSEAVAEALHQKYDNNTLPSIEGKDLKGATKWVTRCSLSFKFPATVSKNGLITEKAQQGLVAHPKLRRLRQKDTASSWAPSELHREALSGEKRMFQKYKPIDTLERLPLLALGHHLHS